MAKPTTSWVIRTKNEEKWLGKVIQKLYSQTLQDFEIIIVDSGSTDKTLSIVNSFPDVKVFAIPPGKFNYSFALNLGISKSQGKYIGIISGHSMPINNKWHEKAIENFSDPKVAATTGYYSSLPDGSWLEKVGDIIGALERDKRNEYTKKMTNTNALIRKDLWKKYPFDESLPECEDCDWASEMLSRGYKIIRDPNFNVYHSHGGINRPSNLRRMYKWIRINQQIDKKPRPTKA